MIIEIADLEDAQEILNLQKLAYQSEAAIYNDYSIPPLTESLEELKQQFTGQAFLKAVLDGRIIGSVRGRSYERTCYIGRLIVHPDYQNQGIGTRLMVAVEHHFHGVRRFELFTGQKSVRNIHLYRKLGYQVFREDQLTDEVVLVYMEKHSSEPFMHLTI